MGILQCGSKLAQPCLSDTDIRYSSTASDDLIDQSSTWGTVAGNWKLDYTYLSNVIDGQDVDDRPPTQFDLTTGQGWPYTRNKFTGITRRRLDGSRFVEQTILFYPPAPEEFCLQSVGEGMANVVGIDPTNPTKTNAKCGVNGNVFYQEVWYTSTYERESRAKTQWVRSGPVQYPSSGPPRTGDSYREVLGDDATYQYVSYDIPGYPFTFGGTETFLAEDQNYAFGTGHSAIGLPTSVDGGSGVIQNAYVYSASRFDDESFLEVVRKAYADNNIVEDEIPDWVKDGNPMPSCLDGFGECPTEEYFCGVNGTDPGCTVSPYQEPAPQMKPGVIAGFVIMAVVVFAAMGYTIFKLTKRTQKSEEDISSTKNMPGVLDDCNHRRRESSKQSRLSELKATSIQFQMSSPPEQDEEEHTDASYESV